jgi:hypothetical protein
MALALELALGELVFVVAGFGTSILTGVWAKVEQLDNKIAAKIGRNSAEDKFSMENLGGNGDRDDRDRSDVSEVSRNASALSNANRPLLTLPQYVARTSDSMNQALFALLMELNPQIADVDLDHVRFASIVSTPNIGQNLLPAEWFARVSH